VGFIRRELPISDPNFGKLEVCTCQQRNLARSETERLYRMSNLEAFGGMTFETFSALGRKGLGDDQVQSLRYALSQAQQYAMKAKGWLVLSGTYGCGKTHLAAAIANQVVRAGIRTLFLTVPDLLDWLRYSYSSEETTYEQRFEEIRNVDLLVLDDLGTQNTTAWAAEKLFQIIDYRYLRRLPLVVTTNLSFAEIDERIRSRLSDPDLATQVRISAPDYRSPVQETRDPLLHHLTLLAGKTFGNFSDRQPEKLPVDLQQSLTKAFRAAQEYSEKPRGWLVLMGDYSTGKTHLAAAIGNYRKGLGEDVIFVVVPDLLDHLRATFNPASNVSYDELFDRVRSAPLLILDDLGTQSATPWAREKLYQLFNFRYNAQLPTVITTASSFEEIDARIRSRMLDERFCKTYKILVSPYHGRSGAAEKPRRTRRLAD